MNPRSLTHQESALIREIAKLCGVDAKHWNLSSAIVIPMEDGGMGSLRFIYPDQSAAFGRELGIVEGNDVDNVLLSISLNVDQFDRPFELDIWKVDFSPLRSMPGPNAVRLVKKG